MMTKTYAMGAAAALALMLAGSLYLGLNGMRSTKDCTASGVSGGKIGGPFRLVDGNGQTVTDSEVISGPTLVYFGYTFCPDVCPFDVARNAAATEILEEKGIKVTPVFVTVDPERDTPEVVKEYAEVHHPRMIGLTGSREQTSAAAKAYKVYHRKQDSEDEYYLVDHTTFTYLMFPDSGFADFFKRDTSAEQLAERVACHASVL